MKLNRTQLVLIACLIASVPPVLAQTTSSPVTTAAEPTPSAPLPDAPSPQRKRSAPPAASAPLPVLEAGNRHFVLVNSLMFASSIANVELSSRCFNSGACTAVPGPLRSRPALYGMGLTTDVGVTVLGYYLNRSGHRWWFVPAAIVTTGNVIYSIHAAHYIR